MFLRTENSELAEELRRRSTILRQEQENFRADAMCRRHHITTSRLVGFEQVVGVSGRHAIGCQLPAIRLQCGQPRIACDALGEQGDQIVRLREIAPVIDKKRLQYLLGNLWKTLGHRYAMETTPTF